MTTDTNPQNKPPKKLGDVLGNVIPENILRAAREAGVDMSKINEPPKLDCDFCQDMGVIKYAVKVDDPRFGKFFPCPRCEKGNKAWISRWDRMLSSSGLPVKYRNLTFDTWHDLPANMQTGKLLALTLAEMLAFEGEMSIAKAYMVNGRIYQDKDSVRNSLVLQGDYGLGKTGLAAAILNVRVEAGHPVLYVRTDDFLQSVRDTFDDKSKTDTEVIDTVKRAPVLILDEFYIQKISDFSRSVMESVIRYRHGQMLSTVITCNQNDEVLAESWGRATVDVILEMAHWAPMAGLKLRDTRIIDETDTF